MSTPRFIYRRAARKSSATTHAAASKQASSFFDFVPSEQSFFSRRTQESAKINRKCDTCEKEDKKVHKKEEANSGNSANPDVSAKIQALQGGAALPSKTRSFFEAKLNADLTKVHIHNNNEANLLASMVGARAFTYKNNIVFNKGEYNPDSVEGKHLLAHELTHVVQQGNSNGIFREVQPDRREETRGRAPRRDFNPELGDFCTPYPSYYEALRASITMHAVLLPAAAALFGPTVATLWRKYLSRRKGDSLSPETFMPGSDISNRFTNAKVTENRQVDLLNIAQSNLSRLPVIPPYTWTPLPLALFVSAGDINFPINFNNPFDTPGHIAGGVGSSDAGPDWRMSLGNLLFYRMTDEKGETTKLIIRSGIDFWVFDAMDFCPGDPGSGLEQKLTIPLSRLEASNWAYDVPLLVNFPGPSASREIQGNQLNTLFPPNLSDSQRRERALPPGIQRPSVRGIRR
jgi:hypothetical protein